MAVNIHPPEGLFDSSHKLFPLYNGYSVASGHTTCIFQKYQDAMNWFGAKALKLWLLSVRLMLVSVILLLKSSLIRVSEFGRTSRGEVSSLKPFFGNTPSQSPESYMPNGILGAKPTCGIRILLKNASRSIAPVDLFPLLVFPTLVVGDLNIHHSLSDPERILTNNESHISAPYFTIASDNSFTLLNIPGVYTRFPFTHSHGPGVLDLAFANSTLLPLSSSWNPSLPPTGSDHAALSVVFSAPLLKSVSSGLDWKRTDWLRVSPLLQAFTPSSPPYFPTPNTLDRWFDFNLSKVTHLISSNTPTRHPLSHSNYYYYYKSLSL